MLLQVSEASDAKIKLLLTPLESELASELQFKQHPNVAKFGASGDKVIALKDPSRSFPVNMSLGVLKWRYDGKDESFVPLSSKQPHSFYFTKKALLRPDPSQLLAGPIK